MNKSIAMGINERFETWRNEQRHRIHADLLRRFRRPGRPTKPDARNIHDRKQYTAVTFEDAILSNAVAFHRHAVMSLVAACITMAAVGALFALGKGRAAKAIGHGLEIAAASLVVPMLMSVVLFWHADQTRLAFRRKEMPPE